MNLYEIYELLSYIYFSICILGLIGNILAFISFCRKQYRKTIFSTYFRILSFIDIIVMLTRIDYFLKEFYYNGLRTVSAFFCKLTMYIIYLMPSISSWIMVLIILDRFLSIVTPSKFLFRKTIKFQLLACGLIAVYNSLISIDVIVSYKFYYKSRKNYSVAICDNKNLSVDLIDNINSSLIPFILMIVLTFFVLKTLFKSRKVTKQNENNKKDLRFAITSISLNVSFVLLKFPHDFYSALSNIIDVDENVDSLIYTILSIMFYSHHGSIFYLTFITNSSFRKDFINSFRF